MSRPAIIWAALGLAGLVVTYWWAEVGTVVFLVSILGLLDRYGVVRLNADPQFIRMLTHLRIEAYYKKGQEIYSRLAEDSTIASEDVRQFVADEWVNPATEYLRGTLGEAKAQYFLAVHGGEPEDAAVVQLGYPKALARERIMLRLERLRRITEGI